MSQNLIHLGVRTKSSSPAEAATDPVISELVARGSPVGIGVSGGKDSTAVAFATVEHLDRVGHSGPRVLVHADLGVTEWVDSLPTCERLARVLGLELMVVKRPKGDMMDRWEQRWSDNVERWETLSCVKLILPWSTPSMRFCTSEMKIDQITRALSVRFPGQMILNVTGIRRAESNERANAPLFKVQPKLVNKTRKTSGFDWNPIADWSLDDVLSIAERHGFPHHEGYTKFGSRRISCVYCILATEKDHMASATDPRNLDVGRRMVDLEIRSTFGFQGNRWLGDTLAPHLSAGVVSLLVQAQEKAKLRVLAESTIPKHLLYTKGWPTVAPTLAEAKLLAGVRAKVAALLDLKPTFLNPDSIVQRYESLLAAKLQKEN